MDTFRALYKKKARGWCSVFAEVDCKISAVFNIGDFDFLEGFVDGGSHAVMRVKVKTLGGKSRYVMLSNGGIVDYNDYAGFKINDSAVEYRQYYKKYKAIKSISLSKQIRCIDLLDEEYTAVEVSTGADLIAYKFNLNKSEW